MLLKCAVLCALLAVGCGPCGGGISVAGDTPFERCMAREPHHPPAAIGTIRFTLDDRALTLTGLPAAPRIAFFQGPGMATQLGHSEALRALATDAPDLMLVLGGIGPEAKGADPWIVGLAKLGRPVLFMAGGRDSAASIETALGALAPAQRKHVVDVTGIHALHLSRYTLALVAGADSGGAAIAETACGFSEADVEAVRATLDEAGERARVLVSWEIPKASKAQALPSAVFGSPLLSTVGEAGAFKAGIHAWPDLDVSRPVAAAGGTLAWGQTVNDLEVVVPRIVGAAHERADGTRQLPGYVILRFDASGILVEKPR